jgi:hypothetical protein
MDGACCRTCPSRGGVRTRVMLRTSGEALTGKAAGGHIRRGGHDGHTVWMGIGEAGCSAPDEGKKKAAHGNARPGVLPDACGLRAQTIEHGRNGDSMVCRGHVGSGLCAVECYGFPFGVPAAVERIEVGLLTCGLMSRPPVSELLVPALGVSGAADTDMSPPYSGVAIGVHHDLLLLFCAVCSTNRLIHNIGRDHRLIQRIVII